MMSKSFKKLLCVFFPVRNITHHSKPQINGKVQCLRSKCCKMDTHPEFTAPKISGFTLSSTNQNISKVQLLCPQETVSRVTVR